MGPGYVEVCGDTFLEDAGSAALNERLEALLKQYPEQLNDRRSAPYSPSESNLRDGDR